MADSIQFKKFQEDVVDILFDSLDLSDAWHHVLYLFFEHCEKCHDNDVRRFTPVRVRFVHG